MALANNASIAAAKFANLSIARQLGLMLGMAATIALGMSVVLWSREPSYIPLFNQISPRDAADVLDVLQRNAIPFKIDNSQGMVMVPADALQNARIKAAAEGLPRGGNGSATDAFSGGSVFNGSQFMENARYKQALENELARTISQFQDIRAARVHLAIPRESVFVRDNREPSASVFLDVYSGLELKKQTIAAVINLVASSIPSLSANRVTVVDQNGQLLNEGAGQTQFSETGKFMDYRESLEQQYSKKIQDILTPILGYGRVKAKVSADIDFTSYEQTQETFNPEHPVLRSEQRVEEKRKMAAEAQGVPGADSNKPSAQQKGAADPKGAPAQADNSPTGSDTRLQSTKNFEVDKTISHTRKQPGTIKRLTVAVLVDNREVMDEKTKKMVNKPLTPKEIDQIKLLVSDAIGIDSKRGDSLNVINSDFVKPEPITALPEEKFWKTALFWSIVKQTLGALFVLALVFGVLRPFFKSLAYGRDGRPEDAHALAENELSLDGKAVLGSANDYESQLSLLRQIVDKEPKRVAMHLRY
jgi:flagellar M-ring protein FliF